MYIYIYIYIYLPVHILIRMTIYACVLNEQYSYILYIYI